MSAGRWGAELRPKVGCHSAVTKIKPSAYNSEKKENGVRVQPYGQRGHRPRMTSRLFWKDIILGGPVFSHPPIIKAHARG